MNVLNKTLLTAALGLGLAQSASAAVSCACEHLGTANDGLCEAQPPQEESATLWSYNQFLLGAAVWYEIPRYKYVFAPTGRARLEAYNQHSGFASYTCQFPYSCGLRVTVYQANEPWKYKQPYTQPGTLTSDYATYVGEANCAFGTGGEGQPR